MNLSKLLLGRADFKSASSIVEAIKTSNKFNVNEESLENAASLLIFKSQTQQCWLVYTSCRLYCVLDDSEKEEVKVLWIREKENMVVDGRISLNLSTQSVSKESGKVFFGNMNNSQLFTKALFKNDTVTGQVLRLAERHFLEKAN